MNDGLNQEMLTELIWAGPTLLGLDEFADFVFEINLEDPDIKEYTELLNKRFDDSSEEIREQLLNALKVLCKKLLVPEKQKEISAILGEIERNYRKQKPNISIIAETSKLGVGDEAIKYTLPIVIALIARDIDAAYHGVLNDKMRQVKNLISTGNTQDAMAILAGFGSAAGALHDVHENLAYIHWKSGDKEKAVVEIKEALHIAGAYWKRPVPGIQYEIIEQLEKSSDEYLARPEKEIIARFMDYTYGMLYDTGAADLDDVISNLDATAVLPAFITKEVFAKALAKDDRFKIKDNCAYLSAIGNIDILLSERKKKKIEFVFFRYSLSEMKLVQEGRMKVLFSEYERYIDNELRRITAGKWNMVSVRRRMRNDITGVANMDSIIASISGVNERKQAMELLSAVWDCNPRWELGGMMPVEYNPKTIDKNKKPPAHSHGSDCSCGHDH